MKSCRRFRPNQSDNFRIGPVRPLHEKLTYGIILYWYIYFNVVMQSMDTLQSPIYEYLNVLFIVFGVYRL